jgi:transposase
MKKADASGIYRMQRFVRALKQDQSAVEAAVEQGWSNGPVEGSHQSTEDTEAPDVWPSRI